jgi:hypothetical protein
MSNEAQNGNFAKPMLAEVRYFLCSSAVIEHFPGCVRSIPFKSGYDFDGDDKYYILATTDFEKFEKYYNEVIQPYNEKSNVDDIDYWLRECCTSQLDNAPKDCLTKCKTYGIFKAIENIYGLTNEKNRAFAVFKMAEYYGIDPIEFVGRVGS